MNDLAFLEGRTGLDLHTPLATVASAHDELVAVLNPIAGTLGLMVLLYTANAATQELVLAAAARPWSPVCGLVSFAGTRGAHACGGR